MDVDSRNRIANEVIKTAKSMTDDLMDEKYLNDVAGFAWAGQFSKDEKIGLIIKNTFR